jgi:nucleolar MIF4G domain-containing protein 1
VDFTVLQKQSRDFFRDFFFQLFISSQVSSPAIAANSEAVRHLTGPRKRESLEEVFSKATRISTLTQGLLYFLTTTLRGDYRSDNEQVAETLKWARDVARDTLRIGLDVVASLT